MASSAQVWTREAVEAMHQEYMESPLPPWGVAREFHIGPNRMFRMFYLYGLDSRRAVGRKLRLRAEEPGKCPQLGRVEFCGFCPCQVPECVAGHAGRQDTEWRCEDCSGRGACSCWSADARLATGWATEFSLWDERRKRAQRGDIQLKRAARSRRREKALLQEPVPEMDLEWALI